MFGWFRSNSSKPKKWRLKPMADGSYMLEKWHPDIAMYLSEKAGVRDQAHADELISNLERETTYRA